MTITPTDLISVCRSASAVVPMPPSAQRALFDALTALDLHFGGHPTFFEDNAQMIDECAATLRDFAARAGHRLHRIPELPTTLMEPV